MKERIWVEDALKHIHEMEYRHDHPSAESLAGAVGITLHHAGELLDRLDADQLITRESGHYLLTDEGRSYARHVIRAHRLYETHLAEETGLSAELWHERAERAEHRMSDKELARLAESLGDPRYDPHGDPIPTAEGELPPLMGNALVDYEAGWEGKIVHIEDEPATVYAQLMAQELAPGMRVRVEHKDREGIGVNVEGRHIELTRPAALNVMVWDLDPREEFDESVTRLSSLGSGERVSVVGLTPACRGLERRRLLDLGMVPGTVVERDIVAPSGNPVAYVVRGATIALRRSQADRVMVRPVQEEAT